MTTKIYKLAPRGAFHFGERGIGLEETADLLHSDTLFAACVSAWRALGERPGADGALPSLAPYLDPPPALRLSSGFPYAGEVLFFPRPQVPIGTDRSLKQIAFISEQALQLLAQGHVPDPESELIQGGQVWVTPDERERIAALVVEGLEAGERQRLVRRMLDDPAAIELWWGSDAPPTPHVTLDRVSAASSLFYTGRLRFAHGCGLYCWATSDDAQALEQLETALHFLQDEGLGGKRSSGHGQFTLEATARDLPAIEQPNAWMTLSLCLPRDDELAALGNAWYRRVLRRGWIYSPDGKNLRRRGVWMLSEGSLLPRLPDGSPLPRPPGGSMVDAHPEIGFPHPVWRSGFAFWMPVRLDRFAMDDIESSTDHPLENWPS